jgi:hypothetical protein
VARRVLVLMPTRSGEPRRVATHSPGKNLDLKARAKAPSCRGEKSFEKFRRSWRTHQLVDDLLDKLSERVVRVLHVQVVDELGDDLRVSLALENVAALFQELLDVLIVGDDAVVDDDERVLEIRALWMRVGVAGDTVSSPTSVRDADVARQRRVNVLAHHLLSDRIFQHLDLARLLDQQDALRIQVVDSHSGRVIATIFQTLQSGDEAVEHLAAGFRRQVVEICKNT